MRIHHFILGLLILFLLAPGIIGAEPADSEDTKAEIVASATMTLKEVVFLWREERYADLYEFGTLESHRRLSREEFERRMQEASKRLQCCWATIQEVRGEYESASEVYVKAKLGYRPRELVFPHRERYPSVLKEPHFEHEVFYLKNQNGRWRVNLYRILEKSGG